MDETDLITTKQAAEELGVSHGRVQQLVAEGRIPSIKIGRDRLIHRNDLELVRERKVGRPPKNNPSPAALAKRKQREKEK